MGRNFSPIPGQAAADLFDSSSWNVPIWRIRLTRPAVGLEFFLDDIYGQMNRDLLNAQWILHHGGQRRKRMDGISDLSHRR